VRLKERGPYKVNDFDAALDAEKAKRWEDALRSHDGNLTHAAAEMGFCKQRAHALTKRFNLLELAKELRLANDQPAVGRPRKSS